MNYSMELRVFIITKVMNNQDFLASEGRLCKKAYIRYYLAIVAILMLSFIISFLSSTLLFNDTSNILLGIIVFFICPPTILVSLWALFAVSCRRCHDIGHSGWWQIIPLYRIAMLFINGDKSDNKYGKANF